ncbi:MAG TPA: hypothetical protein DIU15_20915, partial [Deltaproteobacteria bacterium]|nr:hypothetical protein [Deltaproteobacteria bacterium]HCP48512.1 hypothetical protein [Deltaproteobacteria bacterium]
MSVRRRIVRLARSFGLVLLVPGLLFCGVNSARKSMCLDAYEWNPALGYVTNSAADCSPDRALVIGSVVVPPKWEWGGRMIEGAVFYTQAVVGLATLRSGRSREDASRSLGQLLRLRAGRSLGILMVSLGVLALCWGTVTGLGRWAQRRRQRTMSSGGVLGRALSWCSRQGIPGGLPLPIAGLVVFYAVIRLVPPGHALEYDRAGILWAGIALAIADGAGSVLLRGMRHVLDVESFKPYADGLRMWGCDPGPAIARVSSRVRAAQVRGAILALLGGLLVVEGVFQVNG